MDDIFCKSGRYILNGLADEKPIEEILKAYHPERSGRTGPD